MRETVTGNIIIAASNFHARNFIGDSMCHSKIPGQDMSREQQPAALYTWQVQQQQCGDETSATI